MRPAIHHAQRKLKITRDGIASSGNSDPLRLQASVRNSGIELPINKGGDSTGLQQNISAMGTDVSTYFLEKGGSNAKVAQPLAEHRSVTLPASG